PELGELNSTFKLQSVELPEVKDGQLLIQPIFFSNDPAQRGWIYPNQDERRTYMKPVQAGECMKALALAKVLESKDASIAEGNFVVASCGWIEKAVVDTKDIFSLPMIPGLSPSVSLGAFGGTGLTAFFGRGFTDIAQFKEGQSIIVSAAAGATGNMVVQLAKYAFKAKKVIAIAGSAKKCEWLRTIGADVALNYKESSFKKDLQEAAPDFVDCYFDLVGGDILDACIPLVKPYGRIVACGAITGYNDTSKHVIKNWTEVITNSLTIQGFVVLHFMHRIQEALDFISLALKEGKLKIEETVVRASIEELPMIWMRLFSGENLGKLISQVADL
ncbi:NAD(P)-binding protein, partial [Gymnopus androsaceus JB14]